MCSKRESTLVSIGARSWLPTLTVRLTPDEKRQFVEVAADHGLSKAGLALRIRKLITAPVLLHETLEAVLRARMTWYCYLFAPP